MKISIVAGGTGGHIFPAMALAEELKKNGQAEKITFITAATTRSSWVIKGRKDLVFIPSLGFVGKGLYQKIRALFFSAAGFLRSLMLLRKELPDVACGFGGYVAFPYLMACYMRGIPFFLHEQNLIPGRTTRFLSKFSKEVLTSFPDSEKMLPLGKAFFLGNLCREDFINYHRTLKSSGYDHESRRLILVIGGSQGSHFLNQNVPGVLLKILNDFPQLNLVHICGEKEKEYVKDMYRPKASRVNVTGFSLDMLSQFKDARLVISRGGATILSEICLSGTPSILIPFAKSADNHQYHNALWVKERGAALMVEEKEFSEESFYNTTKDLLGSPEQLKKMSLSLLKLAQPDATKQAVERIVKCCEKV